MPNADVQKFFQSELPQKAAQDVHKLFAHDGSIAFKVGESAWTFRFSSTEPIEPRFDRRARLQLWFTEAAFLAFLGGTLDVSRAVRSREVKAQGELALLEVFGRFLQGEQEALGWEAGP